MPATNARHHRIEVLGPDDIATFRSLLGLFGTAFEELDTYTAAQPGDAYLRQLLAGDTFIAVVAVKDGAVVGGLAAYELKKFERERSEIYIYDLAVAEEHRRQGIATELILRVRDIAAARGAWVVFVQAERDDPPAVALYDKLGTREEALHFDIEVPGER